MGQSVPLDDLAKIQSQVSIRFVFTAFANSILKEDMENYLLALKDIFQQQKIFITGWQLQLNNPELPRNIKVVKDYKDFIKFLG